MKTLTLLSVPLVSILVLLSALYFLQPSATGLAVYSDVGEKEINADVTLTTKEGEVLPKDAIIEAEVDSQKASMTVQEFILKTGQPYEAKRGNFSSMYYGEGFSGNHQYILALSDFVLNRNIGRGEHTLRTRILYRNKVLYEKENKIVIAD